MKRRVAAIALILSAPASAQSMPGLDMPAHDHSAAPAAAEPVPDAAAGTALHAGTPPAPQPQADHYADRLFPGAAMQAARDQLHREHGSDTFHKLMVNLAEYRVLKQGDGLRWDGEGWIGGDLNRLVVKSEGETAIGGPVENAEVQTLYSRAIDPWWDVQAGIRTDIRPGPARAYATVGIKGLAPYGFDITGALFLSSKGDLLARAEGYYDQRITQRWIFQPRIELNFAAQKVEENRIGAGLINAELGLRLRYEIVREFAPYVGISYDRRQGRTARLARAAGEDVGGTGLVAGVRFWF